LTLELTSRWKVIAFADDLIILTRGETVAEAENYMNMELRKIKLCLCPAGNEKKKWDRNLCQQQNSQTS
jgi:hypothetical protein